MNTPNVYEARAIEESLRKDTVFGLSGGNLKRLRYCETLWPEWIAEKRKQVRIELLGEEAPCRDPWHDAENTTGVPGTSCPTCSQRQPERTTP